MGEFGRGRGGRSSGRGDRRDNRRGGGGGGGGFRGDSGGGDGGFRGGGGGYRGGGGGFDRPPREMHKAVCADCGNDCDVPFKPTEGKPVYCRDCFRKRRPY